MIETSTIADKFWCVELGAQKLLPGLHVQAHAESVEELLGERAVYFSSRGRIFVTAPPRLLPELESAFAHRGTEPPIDTFVACIRSKGRIVGEGPAYVGYAEALPGTEVEVVHISREDGRIARFVDDFPLDWEVFGLSSNSCGPFAAICDGQLLGLSHYEIWGEAIAHIGVIVVPNERSRGIGESVVRQAAQHAIASGLLPQYRTLWSNKPSVRIAEKLGFDHYADTVVVRCNT